MKIKFQYLIIFLFIITYGRVCAQVNIYDDFSKKDLPNWTSDKVNLKYSYSEDNADSGYAIIYTDDIIRPNSDIGSITKIFPYLFSDSSILNIMLKGISNDVSANLELLFDIDGNGLYNNDQDIILSSTPFSMNFNGWKQIKITLIDTSFKVISNYNDNYSVILQQSLGLRLNFYSGKNYKDSKFESGIALITEIKHPGVSQLINITPKDKKQEQSYFNLKNIPNPFNPVTSISYNLPENTHVRLTIYDYLGREVVTLLEEDETAGEHSIEFNASTLPFGTYFYRLKTSSYTEVKKMVFEE